MVVYLYRWRLKSEMESDFEKAWSYVTQQLREKSGSLGSRLHRGSDGLWYGYAQWPSIEVRQASNLKHDEFTQALQTMRESSLEMLPEVVLTPTSDFLVLPIK